MRRFFRNNGLSLVLFWLFFATFIFGQSEFLSLFAMVVLSIWLREKNSPESKKIEAPHDRTGKLEGGHRFETSSPSPCPLPSREGERYKRRRRTEPGH